MSSDKEFEDIIRNNGLDNLFDSGNGRPLTLGDLYEGINLLSGAQVDLHHYLKEVLVALRTNNQLGYKKQELPSVSRQQVRLLARIFEDCAKFSEGFDTEGID